MPIPPAAHYGWNNSNILRSRLSNVSYELFSEYSDSCLWRGGSSASLSVFTCVGHPAQLGAECCSSDNLPISIPQLHAIALQAGAESWRWRNKNSLRCQLLELSTGLRVISQCLETAFIKSIKRHYAKQEFKLGEYT